jgi:hypothetical protein
MKGRQWDYEYTSGSDECAFCMGREAAYEGKGEDCNPFAQTTRTGRRRLV